MEASEERKTEEESRQKRTQTLSTPSNPPKRSWKNNVKVTKGGYNVHNRGEYRTGGPENLLPTQRKEERTCVEDSLWVCLGWLGLVVGLGSLRAMHNLYEDTLLVTAQEWVTTHCSSFSLNRVSPRLNVTGGPELALVRLRQGFFIVQLMTETSGGSERNFHCVAFDAEQGLFIDNCRYVGPLQLEMGDRASVESARAVFQRICFNKSMVGYKVSVQNLYELTKANPLGNL